MKTINVEGVPAKVVQVLEEVAVAFREGSSAQAQEKRARVEIPVWPGTVQGHLTRREIYDHL